MVPVSGDGREGVVLVRFSLSLNLGCGAQELLLPGQNRMQYVGDIKEDL